MMCIVFSAVLAVLCMLVDAGLEKFTVHFKVWGAVSGIIIAAVVNYIIFVMSSNRGWDEAIAEFFRTPLLNWGLVIMAVF